MAAATSGSCPRRSTRSKKPHSESEAEKVREAGHKSKAKRKSKSALPEKTSGEHMKKRIKTEPPTPPTSDDALSDKDDTRTAKKSPRKPTKTAEEKAAELQARKLKSYSTYRLASPFPRFSHPTREECAFAHEILARLHGDRVRPEKVVAPTRAAGCGNSPSVLDALVRTVLSQNTSDTNSSRAKRSMDATYGGSDKWEAIVAGGQERLQKAIQSGGLSVVKSKVIIGILQEAKKRHGSYSLDHLFGATDEEAMQEFLSFPGVGPKTAGCVLLFCLQRASFAVDTHVYRLTGLLGWRPPGASREEAQAHLDATVPDEEKYPLHVLLIGHGKRCDECRAGGKNVGRCELRKAFGKKARLPDVAMEEAEEVKEEQVERELKQEEEEEQ